MFRTKRAYEPAGAEDGYRVLVERLWPRGLTKERAALDHWAKEVAPSPALRTWYGHDPERFEAFAVRYRKELAAPAAQAVIADLRRRGARGTVTLVYAARDEEHNSAVLLLRELGTAGRKKARRR
jgi:uncharacterized protein YeaO (DUF488 family)